MGAGSALTPVTALAAKGLFGITPAFQDVSISATQSSAQFDVTLSNKTTIDQNFRLTTADFGSLDESGGVAFLGASKTELDHPYGLTSWMTLEKDAVFLAAGKSADILVTVNNRASLAPGGHYGAVLATAITDTGQTFTGDAGIGVRQVLSSLVLLTKEGGAESKLRLVSQTTNAHTWRLPTSIDQRFQNTGNVHLVPRGVVSVKDPAGRVVQKAVIDEDSGVILPQSFRRYSAKFIHLATAWVPGRYTVVTTYRFDGTAATQTFSTNFWYAGQAIVWAIGAVILLLSAAIIYWLAVRRRRLRML